MTEPRCTAHSKRTGKPCAAKPVAGATVCFHHGGNAPQVRAAAERRLAIQAAIADAKAFGGRLDIHPAQALLELVSAKAAEVAYWERRIQDLDAEKLTFGTTKVESGTDRGEETHIVTMQAALHIAVDQLHIAQRDLAAFAAAALKAGVDEALVKVAQNQAIQLVEVLRQAMSDSRVTITGNAEAVILDALKGKGLA